MSGHAGSVHLVGAGPGDPGLLTLRGCELLRRADVVVFDRLISEELLDHAPSHAEQVDVGKAPGHAPVSQEAINAILVERAGRGLTVVRLKGGDPFVFGRGSEELAACRVAGVPCEVVPGVSSAIAGPAAAGIPVTARGLARSFAVVTARGGDGLGPSDLDYGALARLDTVVVLMGRERLAETAQGLIDAGRSPATPAALIERATCPQQRLVGGTLETIAAQAAAAGLEAPAVLVVGATAAISGAERHDARGDSDREGESDGAGRSGSRRSGLAGRRILVTRPRSASALLVAELRHRGAEVVECPLIRVEEIDPPPDMPDLSGFRWIVLTSLHGVRGFAKTLRAAGLDSRALGGIRIAAVGPRTAAELWDALRLRADLVPAEHRAAALVEALAAAMTGPRETVSHEPRESVLFPCGTLARAELADGLRQRGATVRELLVYRTLAEAPRPEVRRRVSHGVDAVLLYSPSAARSLVEHAVPIDGASVVCVGPTTADAARALGLGGRAAPNGDSLPIVVPDRYGDAGVVAAVERLFGPPSAVVAGTDPGAALEGSCSASREWTAASATPEGALR